MKYFKFADSDLISILKIKSESERKLTVEIIELLIEVDRRKIYLEMGFGSLLDFCVQELKYSESSAFRRIAAARFMQEVPEIRESLSLGKLNIATVAQAHTFIRREKKYNHKNYSTAEKRELISNLENKSKRECEMIFTEISPELPVPEQLRQLAPDKTGITLTVDQKLLEKLQQLKLMYSHIISDASYSEIIEIMADRLLKAVRNSATPPGGAAVAQSVMGKHSRYVSAKTIRQVFLRDDGRCTFVNIKENRRCTSRYQLEYDHKYPFSLGGESSADNIRLLFRRHNQFYAHKLGLLF